MSNKSTAATTTTGFPLGALGLLFWLVVHYAVPLGTTWGGASAHEIAYIVLWVTVLGPLAIIGVILAIVLIAAGFSVSR